MVKKDPCNSPRLGACRCATRAGNSSQKPGRFFLPDDAREHAVRHEPTSGIEDASLNYRVAWRSVAESGATHERIFTNRDHGWDFYQDMQKGAGAYNVTWEHIAAQ